MCGRKNNSEIWKQKGKKIEKEIESEEGSR